jgi:hypothetical protein
MFRASTKLIGVVVSAATLALAGCYRVTQPESDFDGDLPTDAAFTGTGAHDSESELLPDSDSDTVPPALPESLTWERFPHFCSLDGWCGAAVAFTAVSGSSRDDVWVAAAGIENNGPDGTRSALLHWDGALWSNRQWDRTAWTDGSAVPETSITALFSHDAEDVWAAGTGGVVIRFNGSVWSELDTGTDVDLSSVWAGSGEDVWVAGDRGEVRRFDGSGWYSRSISTDVDIDGIWGLSDGAVIAVGNQGLIHRFDGTTWHGLLSGTTADLTGVWGSAEGPIWVVGAGGTVLRSDTGIDWSAVAIGSYDDLAAVWGTAADDVWIAGKGGEVHHFDGREWERHGATPLRFNAIWSAPDSQLLAVGSDGGSLVGDSAGFDYYPRHLPVGVAGLWPTGERLWVVGANGEISRFDGTSWDRWLTGVEANLNAVWGARIDDAWAAGNAGTLLHWDGTDWRENTGPTEADLNALWGSAADDAWAVGESGVMLHFDGTEWSGWPEIAAAELRDIWGTSKEDVWAVGAANAILRFDGVAWNLQPDPYAERYGYNAAWWSVFGVDDAEIWFSGTWSYSSNWSGAAGPALTRWFEEQWDYVYIDQWVFQSAWPLAKDDIWALSSESIVHWNGTGWEKQYTGSAVFPNAVSVLDDKAVIVIDKEGTVLRRSL